MVPSRVGFFTECYTPIVNGVVASIDALRDGLRAEGVEVTTIAPRMRARIAGERDDIVRVPSLPLPTSTAYRLVVPYVPRAARRRVAAFDVVHAHSPFVTGWMAARAARRGGVPLVFTYHTRLDAYAHYAPFGPRTSARALAELTRRFADLADVVVVPTEAMETRLRALGVRAPIAVVPSPIDVARFAAGRASAATRALLGGVEDVPLVLAVARLAREKGLELALEALARAPELRLAVVGDGPERAALEARARDAGCAGRVRFVGALPPAALPDVYASADVFVHTSTTETQGLVLAEALAAGLPVVAVDAPTTREVAGDRARLVPPDPAALAAALAAAALRGRDESAVQMAHRRFSLGSQARALLEVYRAALAPRTA